MVEMDEAQKRMRKGRNFDFRGFSIGGGRKRVRPVTMERYPSSLLSDENLNWKRAGRARRVGQKVGHMKRY